MDFQNLQNFSFGRQPNSKLRVRQSESGQIVVEYVLLLAIAVGIALVVTNLMVGRTKGEEGFVIRAWQQMNMQIGQDLSDDVKK